MSILDYVSANPDIIQDSKDLLLGQFVDSVNINELIEIFSEEFQLKEQAAEELFTAYLLSEAEGVQLDIIGEFLNIPRNDKTDEDYRVTLVISALGSTVDITRDGVHIIAETLSNSGGAKFYTGRFHDVYTYLQDACVEKESVAEILDTYMPINTQNEIVLVNGLSFGFEGDDDALGFDYVRRSAGQGDIHVKYDADVVNSSFVVLPRGTLFDSLTEFQYQSLEDVDVSTVVTGVEWLLAGETPLNATYMFGVADPVSGTVKTASVTANAGTAQERDAQVLDAMFDFLFDNGLVPYEQLIRGEDAGTEYLYAGYDRDTITTTFVSRASTATYIDENGVLQYAAVDEERFNNPEGVNKVIAASALEPLYENEVENVIVYSEDISNAYWDKVTLGSSPGTITVTGVASSAPDGTSTSYSVAFPAVDGTNDTGSRVQVSDLISADGKSVVLSFYAKSNGSSNKTLQISLVESADQFSTPTTILATTDVTDDWSRFEVEINPDALSGFNDFYVAVGCEQDVVNSSLDILLWGVQVEDGEVATSYIPTSGTTETRAQDIVDESDLSNIKFLGFEPANMSIDSSEDITANFWSVVSSVATTEGYNVINPYAITGFAETPPEGFIDATNSEAFDPGFGDPFLDPPEESTAESGDLAMRLSLSSIDTLNLRDVEEEQFEYELDASFSEILSIGLDQTNEDLVATDFVEDFRVIRAPLQDETAIKNFASVAVRSPDGVEAFSNLLTGGDFISEGIDVRFPLGEQTAPLKPFYFEFEIKNLSPIVGLDQVSMNILFGGYDYDFEPVDGVNKLVSVRNGVFSLSLAVGFLTNFTSVDFKVSGTFGEVDQVYDPETEAYVLEKLHNFSSTIVSENQTDPALITKRVVGFRIDPVTKTIKSYIDGVDQGFVTFDSGSDINGVYEVGDPATWTSLTQENFFVYTSAETNNDDTFVPAPTTEDHSVIAWNYKKEHFSNLDHLPKGTVDIFGRDLTR